MEELDYYLRIPSYRKITKLINEIYETTWDGCLRTKTTKERLECVRELNNLWNVRRLYFKLRDYESYHVQLNQGGID